MAGDDYVWGSAVEGSWNNAANWDDTTTGQNPAAAAPGSQDDVTIGAAGGGATRIVGGTGQSNSLTLTAPIILSGDFTTGTLVVNAGTQSGEILTLDTGHSLDVSGDAAFASDVTAEGDLSIGGNLSMAGDKLTASQDLVIGGDLTGSGTLQASAGLTVGNVSFDSGSITAANATMGDVAGASLTLSGASRAGTLSSTSQQTVEVSGSLELHAVASGGSSGSLLFNATDSSVGIDQGYTVNYSTINLVHSSLSIGTDLVSMFLTLSVNKNSYFDIIGSLQSQSDAEHGGERFPGAKIAGSFEAGSIVGTGNGFFANVLAGGAVIVHGDVTNAEFYTAGQLTIDGTLHGGYVGYVSVSGTGHVQLEGAENADLFATSGSAGSIEIGNSGNATSGAVTVDAGITVTNCSLGGSQVIDNGTIHEDSTYRSLYGALTGTGTLELADNATSAIGSFGDGAANSVTLGSGSTLFVGGAAANSTASITLSGPGDVLELNGSQGSYSGTGTTISGFDTSDAIEVYNVAITDATYSGVLTLSDDGTIYAQFALDGNYSGATFDVVSVGNDLTQIALGPQWADAASGDFSDSSNWSDGIVPGSDDNVGISVAGTYTVAVTSAIAVDGIDESASGATLAIATDGGTDAINQDLSVQGTLTVDATGGGSTLTVGGMLDNAGTVTIGNSNLSTTTTVTAGAIANSGVLDLDESTSTGASAEPEGSRPFAAAASGGGSIALSASSLTNAGAINVAANSVGITFGFDVDDTGIIKVTSGLLHLAGASNSFTGRIGGFGGVSFNGGVTTMGGGASLTTATTTIKGAGTALNIAENLGYAGRLTEGAGTAIRIAAGYALTLRGTSLLAGTIGKPGTLRFEGGSTTLRDATVTVGALQVAGADVTLGSNLVYAGAFGFGGTGSEIDLDGHTLTLTGTTAFGSGAIVGDAGGTDSLVVRGAHEDLSKLTFSSWTNGADKVTLNGTAGVDHLVGSSRSDTITGGAGNDVLTGGAGADLFVYHQGWGHDTITDFTAGSSAGHDTIQIDKTLFANYAELMSHTIDSGSNAIITSGSNTITLDHVHKADLVAGDFKFK